MAISGAKTVAEVLTNKKHGRGPDKTKRKPRNSSVSSVMGKKGKTWESRDI